jgi:hypothetical protein
MTASRLPIPELERVVLTQDLEDNRFKAGDVGTIVHVYAGGEGYELEFFTLNGETIDVVTVDASQVQTVDESYITHARKLAG